MIKMAKLLIGSALSLAALSASASLFTSNVINSVGHLQDFLKSCNTNQVGFIITGRVNHVSTPKTPHNVASFILEDASDVITIFNCVTTPPAPGSIASAKGIAYSSSIQEPWMYCLETTALSAGKPPPPIRCSLQEMCDNNAHDRLVETEAAVIDIFQDEISPDHDYLQLKDDDTIVLAATKHNPDLFKLRDARIRLCGIFNSCVFSQRKFTGPCIFVNSDDITVLVPPPSDPFDFPELKRILYISPRDVARMGKRRISGHVIATWQHNNMFIRTGMGMIVGIELARGETLPAYGSVVTIVGQPTTDLFRISLSQAKVRIDASLPFTDDSPVITTADAILTGNSGNTFYNDEHRGKLVTLSGIVRSLPSPASTDIRLLMDCGRFKVPVDYSSNPSAAENLLLDSEIEVTGRCLLETDKWQPHGTFPHIKGLSVVIRKPDDIRILRRPPWWTPQRLLMVIGVLLLALVGVYVRNRILKRMGELKLGERTRLAVELHDSLSQTLAGVACQIAASDNAIDAENAVAKDRIKTAERMLKSCRTELRHCLFDLRSDTLEEKDFSAALRKTLDQLEGDADIAVRFNVPRTLLDDAVAHAIIAIVRELTGNALRHGNATKVRVAGSVEDGHVHFSVADNGCGFDPARCAGSREGHFGIEGIRDRMKKLRGTFEIKSVPDKGTKAVLSIPLSSKTT